ncbi:hypothetical protein DY000_02024622 [Brassica cretica]|uniref:DUF4283 domain-containing protein n=1 Tax=Brassica cretica TaxID=69181 RepID=A0ABQ7EHH2_BRACR|nr:hypothetical protein DY000_02024622 [Brassica cretica]
MITGEREEGYLSTYITPRDGYERSAARAGSGGASSLPLLYSPLLLRVLSLLHRYTRDPGLSNFSDERFAREERLSGEVWASSGFSVRCLVVDLRSLLVPGCVSIFFGDLAVRSSSASDPAPLPQWLGELRLCHLTLEASLELKHAGWMVLSFNRFEWVWLDVLSACLWRVPAVVYGFRRSLVWLLHLGLPLHGYYPVSLEFDRKVMGFRFSAVTDVKAVLGGSWRHSGSVVAVESTHVLHCPWRSSSVYSLVRASYGKGLMPATPEMTGNPGIRGNEENLTFSRLSLKVENGN